MPSDLSEIVAAIAALQATTLESFGSLDTKSVDLGARLTEMEQKAARRGATGSGNLDGSGDSLGSLVEKEFKANADLFGKTKRVSFEVETKTLTSLATGAHASRDVPNTPLDNSTSVIGLLSPGPLEGLSVLHYPRRTGTTGAAAVQAGEGEAKAETQPVFAAISQAAITIAGFAVVSEQALSTAGGLRRAVDSHLNKSVRDTSSAVLMGGTIAAQWPFAGYVALAGAFVGPAGFPALADGIMAGALRMRLQGFAPSIVVLSEAAFLGVQLAKDDNGRYLTDLYLADLSMALGGMKVGLSADVPDGSAMLIDPAFVGYLASGTTRISVGTVNDQFTRNLVTVKAEIEILPFMSDYQALMMVTPAAA
jgi:HK97 family phage major capsid protein